MDEPLAQDSTQPLSVQEKKRQPEVDEEIQSAPLEESSKASHDVCPTVHSVIEESPVLLTPQGKHQIVAAEVHHDPPLDRGKEVQAGEGDEIRQVGTIPDEGPQLDRLEGISPLQPPGPEQQSTPISTIKESPQVVSNIAETEEHICKHMSASRKCSFEDLLPENPIRLEAVHLFNVLLVMHSKMKVKVDQLIPYGNITVTFLQE
ncbi:hypothetical protein Pcinc_002986 [Petrolisthes cinctipes]|uniref:Rad21/Rec8-like protein C-terminal eukaryotic domain-containing protein n=1 Tax=Petrolisthes cinctipes TaxID=88211 RepID=A0AAE1L2F3_PETCI|nr:hypothetical protein Pcinc_002986 [Petrolisthes cinctipes]